MKLAYAAVAAALLAASPVKAQVVDLSTSRFFGAPLTAAD
jgi:hypothetical protein